MRVARLQQVLKAGGWRRRDQRDNALVLPRAGGAIELDPLLKPHGNAVLSRQTHQFFDAVAVAATRDNQGIKRPIGFERFAYGMDPGETVHGLGKLLFNQGRRKIQECECERI